MIKLSVNINKIATLRNARGGSRPDVLKTALDCEHFGADGITVHPRPDERHIRYSDVYALKERIQTEFNIEGYPSASFIKMVLQVKPAQVTLVPDPPDAITSNAGWNTDLHRDFLRACIIQFKDAGIRCSIFLDPNPALIELYTENYAKRFPHEGKPALLPYIETARKAGEAGLGINAGHDLDLDNLSCLAAHLPGLQEVSIGHALICDALYYGLHNTIQMYKAKLQYPV
jgi:pyridoxine 5-phosphate synthase